MTLILGFANKKYNNDTNLSTAIGTVNIIINIIIYPIFAGLTSYVEIMCSQSYAAGKKYIFGLFLSRARIIGYILTLIAGVIIVILNKYIMKIWDLNEEIIKISYDIMIIRLISCFFELESYLMLRFIKITNKGKHGLWLVTLNVILLPVYCLIFIYGLNLYSIGCGLIVLFTNASTVITLWVFIIFKCYDKEMLCFIHKEMFSDVVDFLKLIIPLYLLSLMDFTSCETMSIIANYFDEKFYSAFLNVYSLYYLINTLALGFQISTSIAISRSIAKGDGTSTKRLFIYILFIAIILAIIVCLLSYLFSYQIIELIAEKDDILELSVILFQSSILCNLVDIISYVLSASMKAVGRVYIGFYIYVIFNILNFLAIYLYGF